jgi:fructokinase
MVEGHSAPLLVVGEALIDFLPDDRGGAAGEDLAFWGRPGGSPANVAVGLSRLGVAVAFAGRFSRSGLGPWRRRRLAEEGVDLAPSVDADEPTTLAVVSLDEAGVASYEFYGPGTADWWWRRAELPDPALLAGGAVHTGSLATAVPPGAEVLAGWLAELRAAGDVVVSYDPNVRPSVVGDSDRCRAAVAPFVAQAHLVKVSVEDLDVLHPGVPPLDAAAGWLSTAGGPELVVVTQGGDGAVALHRDGRRRHRQGRPVTVADTVGAGDSFTSGLVARLGADGQLSPEGLASIDDADLVAALDQANLVAALTCERMGADPPRASEISGRVLGNGMTA